RAALTNWGQIGFRKGEVLAWACLSELIPARDWRLNNRPAELEGLELDIWRPSLKLALEHHGAQHYGPRDCSDKAIASFAERQSYDAHKRGLCRKLGITLLEMKYSDLSPAHFLAHIRELCHAAGFKTVERPRMVERVTAKWETALI